MLVFCLNKVYIHVKNNKYSRQFQFSDWVHSWKCSP